MAGSTVISALLFLACASCLNAEIVATLARSSAGTPEVRIRNSGTVSLTALAIALNPTREAEDRTQFVQFVDAVVDNTEPLEAEHERAVPAFLRLRPGKRLEESFELPIITAGILADGSITGTLCC